MDVLYRLALAQTSFDTGVRTGQLVDVGYYASKEEAEEIMKRLREFPKSHSMWMTYDLANPELTEIKLGTSAKFAKALAPKTEDYSINPSKSLLDRFN